MNTEDTNKESEVSEEALADVTGGGRNADHPIVRTAMEAFDNVIDAAADAAEKKRNMEIARNTGIFSSTTN